MRTNSIQYPPITSSGMVSPIDTTILFEEGYLEPNLSPIDQYYENNKSLNLIACTGDFSHDKASIVFLGFMSAVESYLRAIFRGVICIDEYSQKLIEDLNIPYAAAIYHENHLLPEALFESTSLANPQNIRECFRNFLGIKGNLPTDVEKVLSEFYKVCELRHCCVHRFGKLGTKNAVRLGLLDHHKLLEKPLQLSQANLEDISFLLRSLVNTINRYLFEFLLDRMGKNKGDHGLPLYSADWSWNFNKDRKRFLKYYSLFASNADSAPSPSAKDIYFAYRSKYKC